MNKYLTEFIGTFFLVFTIGCSVINNATGPLAPLAIGAALMVMIFAGGHISGAHYNPAVTLGVFLRGSISLNDAIGYWIFQIIAAFVAGGFVKYLKSGVPVIPMNLQAGPSLLVEFLFTFALVFVVLNVATSRDTENNSFYGLAIGMTVMTGAFAVGGISGGAFNPAVAFGISFMGLESWSNIWIFLLANFAGGAAAAYAFKVLSKADGAGAPKDV